MSAIDVSPPQVPQGDFFVNPVDGPYIRFPPFPKHAEGKSIMSFKEFKEGGICVNPGRDDQEVDTHGIPTIPLRVKHKTDVCKTNTKRKRQAEEATARKKAGGGTQRFWWEQWEDSEVIRFSIGFNPYSSRFERIYASASDFANGRTWPINFKSETGPKFIWDKFVRYIGVTEGSVVPQDTGKKKDQKNDDVMSDDEVDTDAEGENDEGYFNGATSGNATAGIVSDRELPGLAAKAKALVSNEEKLSTFFNNPEMSFKVFMTSFARQVGFIWSDVNLECLPRVLLFFVNFLLRSKVLPEIERSLRRSAEVITLALTELPNTSGIAKVFPDEFSLACSACWGKRADGYTTLDLDEDIGTNKDVKLEANVVTVEEEAIVQREHNPSAETGWGTADAVEQTSSWGTTKEEGTAWGSSGYSNGWDITGDTDAQDSFDWSKDVRVYTLTDLLGPTALPLTHQPGIVERSMRRIVSIVPPNPNPPKSTPQGEGVTEPDADAVEVDLDRLFTKIVLSPMVDWDGGEAPVYSIPTILKTSRGLVIEPGAPEVPEGTTPKSYNPLAENITLLIENKEANMMLLRVGMAIGGTWVQLARQGEVIKKKKKGKNKRAIPNYWYLDELAIVVPSFWEVPAK